MAASFFTLDDLMRTLRATAGGDGNVGLDSGILDICFDELGYDSLAMLETTRCIELECGITLDDSTVTNADTPRAFLAVVNEELATKHAV